jgi:hypothetical protein
MLALPLVAVLLAGCGGGGDDSSETTTAPTVATTTALSKAELIEQGDAICAEVNAAVGTVGTSSSEAGSPAAQAAGLYSGMIDSLKGLGRPQEADGYAEFSAAADELATAEDEVELAAEREDTAALETAEANASTALGAFQEAAEEYGFEECGEGPSAPVETLGSEAGSEAEAESGEEAEAVEPEAPEPEVEEVAPEEVAPETGGAGGTAEGGGATGAPEAGGGGGGGESGGIGPG